MAHRTRGMSLKPRMGAIVFFDMPGSTGMMIRDPRTAVPAMFQHNAMCRVIIESNEGRIIKELGDGLMVKFANAGTAVKCAIKVIQNLRKYGGGIRTKATVSYGTIWNVTNPSGDHDVYGTPVHVSARMERYAAVDTIVIDSKDKGPALEWLERTNFRVERLRKKLNDYPDIKLYVISVK